MKVAICGPADLHLLAKQYGIDTSGIPTGFGATPLAPLIGELLRRHHQVTLYTLSCDIQQEAYFEWGSLRIFVGPARAFGGVRTFYHSERAYLKRVILDDRPRFVHSHWTYEFTLGALAANVPTLVTIHDLPWNVLRYFRDRCRAVRLMLAYSVALRATKFTAVSERAAQHFRHFMRPGAHVVVVPNFVPNIVLLKSKGPQRHPKRPLVFASILQGWTERKNPKAALRAFTILRQSQPESRLLMIGTDYGEHGPAAEWSAIHGTSEAVEFLGRQPYERLMEILVDRVDALVMPSLDEAFSMTILENMALGKPVIAGSLTPGVSEQLDHGQAGILVNVRSPQAIADSMHRLQEDENLYARLSKAGHDRVVRKYTAATVVPLYERLYYSLLQPDR